MPFTTATASAMSVSPTSAADDDRAVFITDVLLRDGLQNQPVHVSLSGKLLLLHSLVAAGVKSAEITSFVSPKAVPQMADAGELMQATAQLPVRLSVLAPNMKGLERAAAAGASEVAIVLSATDTMNRKNINMGLDDALRVSLQTLRASTELGLRTRAYIAVAFECPFEGRTPVERVRELAVPLLEAGAGEIVIADTIGAAAPGEVQQVLEKLLAELPACRVGMHFHDTRGMGVANAFAALQMGIRRFDASTGGVGGCPFAPGASGNLATEDLVLMAEQSGYNTGISLSGLVAGVDLIQNLLGGKHGGGSMQWLRREASRRSASY